MERNDKNTCKTGELAPPRRDGAAAPRRVDIRDLLGGGRELRILHGAEEYRLTLTSKGKLILTK
jgi:hemin uptake protein HemP